MKYIFSLSIILVLLSTSKVDIENYTFGSHYENDTLRYFFTGHTYSYQRDQKVDYRLEAINFDEYDAIWLGGDICTESSMKYSTLQYIDSLFQIGKPNNHWALGNHDHRNGNYDWVSSLTQRPLYYTHHQGGITVIVMNTNLNPSNCEDLEKQYTIIKNVCDTISESSHLLFLMHHQIVRGVPDFPQSGFANETGLNWNVSCESASSNYMTDIYPLQKEVRSRGIEVLNIIGDSGWGGNRDFMSQDSIWYLSSGLSDSQNLPDTTDLNKVIIFEHLPSERKLTWSFQSLLELFQASK